MKFRREGNESSGVDAYDPLLDTERSKIVVKYKCPLCRHVREVREVLHTGHGQFLCSNCLARAKSYPVQETRQSEVQVMSPYTQLPNNVSANAVSSVGQRDQPIEHTFGGMELKHWRQEIARSAAQVATRSKGNPKETCIIFEFTEVRQLCQVDYNGEALPIISPAFYSDKYEHKLGIRMYPCGLGEGRNRFVAVFIHMMSGKYDNIYARWPFTPRITVSILDQSGNERHISQMIQAKPNMVAFQKPTEEISRTGCGLVKFAPIEEVFGTPYIKDDKLFLKVEFLF